VDIEKAIAEVMNEYETRFPLTKKFNNGNKYAGGSDLKKEHTTNGGTKNE
jgi:ABC-type sulfate transport system substrate-binding protein